MSPEKQRIAIATACGWTEIQRRNNLHMGLFGLKPVAPTNGQPGGTRPVETTLVNVPNYLGSLDAMHEAEEFVKNVRGKYVKILNSFTDPACATAPQRAEAFLRTLSLWTED